MSKHTPGPWVASCRHINYDGGEWSEDEFLQWEVDGPRTPSGRGQFFQADALLIAAAPDLLEACIDALEALRCNGLEARNLCRAIEKATGEQP